MGAVQATMDSRDVAHPDPEERTREVLWSMVILPSPHQLQLRKQLSTNEFNFHVAFQGDQSLNCCAEHLRSPVVRDLKVIRISRHTPTPGSRALRRVEISELMDEGRYVEGSDRIPSTGPGETLVCFTLGILSKTSEARGVKTYTKCNVGLPRGFDLLLCLSVVE